MHTHVCHVCLRVRALPGQSALEGGCGAGARPVQLLSDVVTHLCCHPMYRMLSLRAVPQVGHTTSANSSRTCATVLLPCAPFAQPRGGVPGGVAHQPLSAHLTSQGPHCRLLPPAARTKACRVSEAACMCGAWSATPVPACSMRTTPHGRSAAFASNLHKLEVLSFQAHPL